MPLIVVKAYPKDEKIKQEIAEEITQVFTEKWGCPREAVTVKIESYAPDVWQREIKEKEISGSLACDGFASSISSLFRCSPITSFSQNVGLIAMTKVVNRFTIMTGAACMILASMFPPIGAFFASLPDPVLGGCTVMMFGAIMVSGIQMMAAAGFTQRNVTIAAISLSFGIGATQASEAGIWQAMPQLVQDVFGSNCVAVVFVISVLLSALLPKDMEISAMGEVKIDEEEQEEGEKAWNY